MKRTNQRIRTYAFDFDGVIAKYDGIFRGHEHLEKPHKEVVKVIRELKKRGHKTLVYSTRSSAIMKKYCKKYKIPIDYFNENPNYETPNPGKPIASAYIDDRAVCYNGQKAKQLLKQLLRFEPWYKK